MNGEDNLHGCDIFVRHLGDIYIRRQQAASFDHIEALQTLLAAGADPNAVDEHGRTPLHSLSEGINPETVRILIEAGANPEAVDAPKGRLSTKPPSPGRPTSCGR